MLSIESHLEEFCVKYSHQNILIAYSGGVDSQVLLHCLASLKKQNRLKGELRVCHVDHGLSANALKWQEFAKAQCQQFNLPLNIISVNVQTQAQKSLEALARDARYHALQSAANLGDLIVTGHHSDDQAETFLLALKRGSGLKGLSAMQSEMALGEQLLVRPLLNISRADIEAYAKINELVWIEDESNTDERFDRNFLRHQVLPKLNERWPSINKTIARSAKHCFEAQQLLNELAEQDLAKCQNSINTLDVASLLEHSQARLNNLLRYFLTIHDILMPSRQQLQQICLQLSAEADKSPVVQLADCCLRRYKGELYLTPVYQDISLWQHKIDMTEKMGVAIILPDNLGTLSFLSSINNQQQGSWQAAIKPPLEHQVVSIRFSHDNPRCLPQYRQHSRPLKKVLQELSIPPWQRKQLPFIFYDNELVAVAGHFICTQYLANKDERPYFISWNK